MKKITAFLIALTLVALSVNVCFASDVGIPAATHSTIVKESPATVNTTVNEINVVAEMRTRFADSPLNITAAVGLKFCFPGSSFRC